MRRRLFLLGLPLALSGCGSLLSRPYVARQDWAFDVPSPGRGSRQGGKVLVVRSMAAAPSLGDRGLKALQPDGTMTTDFYERWAVPPAEGAGAALTQYLAGSGLFAAVLGSGSLAAANLVLEPDLLELWSEPGRGVAAISFVLLRPGVSPSVLLQRTERAVHPLGASAAGAPASKAAVDAQLAALGEVFRMIAGALAQFE